MLQLQLDVFDISRQLELLACFEISQWIFFEHCPVSFFVVDEYFGLVEELCCVFVDEFLAEFVTQNISNGLPLSI